MFTLSAETDPIEHQTLAAQVYARLSSMLASGQLAPGEKLPLRAVSEVFGTSMMPTREAVTRLVTEGALEVVRGRAVRVPVMTLGQFADLTRVRIEIEGFAAAETSRKCSAEQLADIREASRAFERECRRPSPDAGRAIACNQAFHFSVYEASGSPTLFSIVKGLWLKAGPVLNLDLRANPVRLSGKQATLCHALVISAIERKDPNGARDAIASDITATADLIIEQGGLPG